MCRTARRLTNAKCTRRSPFHRATRTSRWCSARAGRSRTARSSAIRCTSRCPTATFAHRRRQPGEHFRRRSLSQPLTNPRFQSTQRCTLTVRHVAVANQKIFHNQTLHVANRDPPEPARFGQAEIRDDRRRQLLLQLDVVVATVQKNFH